ncbi:DDE-TNP-IS1595 domain-containing protein [Vairimorpha necatrix]|uniref:DDE-TNP-IS1595 domain-containing protein n=1 Tax=Vairimorpha necatrix TaxID=6039 RepID=A0AAX4JFI4_9MICR
MKNSDFEISDRIPKKSTKVKIKPIQRLFYGNDNCFNLLIELEVLSEQKNIYFILEAKLGVSSSTVAKAKKRLRQIFKNRMSKSLIIGGPGKIVQVDESVICRRCKIRYPTSSDDSIPDVVWILGMVEADNPTNFYITRVENRTVECLTEALKSKIGIGSILHSDGHPSYPGLARNLCLEHKVVNHSLGFRSPDGTHSNNIENIWSQFKSEMTKEHGVKRKKLILGLLNLCLGNFIVKMTI